MAVPDTTTFTFQDVTNEIYGDTNTGRNLLAAHDTTSGTDADINLYDPEYIGDQNTLYNFRNYGGGTLNLTAAGSTCTGTYIYSVVSSNENIFPVVGDFLVVDMDGDGADTSPFVGIVGQNYIFNWSGTSAAIIRINTSGEITAVPSPC